MINFYKQDGIGKIAFNDGNIYVPQGNVTLLLDTTTEKIIVAEDERLIYWISLSQPLEVNGSQISGTDAEKLALIAPVFQNEGGGGGTGGASARFGIEDNTSDVDRFVDLMGNSSDLVSGGSSIHFGSSYAETYISNEGSTAKMQSKASESQTYHELLTYSILLGYTTLRIEPGTVSVLKNSSQRYVALSVNGNFADTSGNIPLVPTQSFDSNAEAVAALGVGKLYKSTTLINGSPIILITV